VAVSKDIQMVPQVFSALRSSINNILKDPVVLGIRRM